MISARQPCPHCMHAACRTRAGWDRNDGVQRAYATQPPHSTRTGRTASTARMFTPHEHDLWAEGLPRLESCAGQGPRPAARSAQPAGQAGWRPSRLPAMNSGRGRVAAGPAPASEEVSAIYLMIVHPLWVSCGQPRVLEGLTESLSASLSLSRRLWFVLQFAALLPSNVWSCSVVLHFT